MSRKAERRLRQRGKLKSEIRVAAIVALLGVVFLALGAVGLIQNFREYSDYLHAEEILTVSAEITAAEPRTKKDETGSPYTVYDVQLKYSADGKDYTGKTRLYEPAAKGDTREIEVYRTAGGDCRIPEITSRELLFTRNLIPLIGALAGAFLAAAGGTVAISGKRSLKKLNG